MIERGTLFGSYVEEVKRSLDMGMIPSAEVCRNLINIIEILDAKIHNLEKKPEAVDVKVEEVLPYIHVTQREIKDWITRKNK